jgi:mRNA interferase RelE/StbE
MVAPEEYGDPLRGTLKGVLAIEGRGYRVVFTVKGDRITIPGIRHRRDNYKIMTEDRAGRHRPPKA